MKYTIKEYEGSTIDVISGEMSDAQRQYNSPEAIKKRAVDNAIYYIQENLRKDQAAILNTNQVMLDDQAMQLIKSLISKTQANVARNIEKQRRYERLRMHGTPPKFSLKRSVKRIGKKLGLIENITEARGGGMGRVNPPLAPVFNKNMGQNRNTQGPNTQRVSGISQGINSAQSANPSFVPQGQQSVPVSTTYQATPGASTTPTATVQQQQIQTSTAPPPPPPNTASTNPSSPNNGSYILLNIISSTGSAFSAYPGYSSTWVYSLVRYPQLVSELNEVSQNIRKDSRNKLIILPSSMANLKTLINKFYNLAASENQREDTTNTTQSSLIKNAAKYGYLIKQVILANNQNAAIGTFNNKPVAILVKNNVQMNFYKNTKGNWLPFYSIDPATMGFTEPDPKLQYDTKILDNVKDIFDSVDYSKLADISNYKQFNLANGADNLTKWSSVTESYTKLNNLFERIIQSY